MNLLLPLLALFSVDLTRVFSEGLSKNIYINIYIVTDSIGLLCI